MRSSTPEPLLRGPLSRGRRFARSPRMIDIKQVGILGAGTMGHGIAHVCALAGYQVVLQDPMEGAAQKGLEKIKKNLDVGVEKKKVEPAARDAALTRITA